jgi:hypothetical protein
MNRLQREKESELEKLKTAFENQIEQHAATFQNYEAEAQPTATVSHTGGARPKQRNEPPPTYCSIEEEDESSNTANGKTINSSNWSFPPNKEKDEGETSQTVSSLSVFRLPKLDLKPFDGDPKNWQNFISIFKDLVHNNKSISTTQKMAILKQCLTADIRDGLGDSLSSPALYNHALQELQSTYGHPQIVSRTYLQTLIQLPRINTNDYKALLKFSQTVNGAVSSLKSGGYQHELESSGFVSIISSKLPPEVQSRWGINIVRMHPACLTLQDFSLWLSTVVKVEMMAKHSQIQLLPIPPVK